MQRYDGNEIVAHTIRPGETLASIARGYGFTPSDGHQPIYNYNTAVRQRLTNSADRIRAGETVLIPLSRDGYRKRINNMIELRLQIQNSASDELGRLEERHYRHLGSRVLWDLAGEIATFVGTVAVKAIAAANAAAQATAAVGRSRAAAHYLAKREAEKLAGFLKDTLVDTTVKNAVGIVDSNLGDVYTTGRKASKAIPRVSTQAGRSFLDISDMLVSLLNVSTVADWYLRLSIGTTPQATYEEMTALVKKYRTEGERSMARKIEACRRERRIVYTM